MENQKFGRIPVPRADSAARANGHLPALDGLRGAAALLVVVSHLHLVKLSPTVFPQSGTFGVMIFFVLSGFLMGHLYLFKPFTTASVVHFIAARIARVLPLFYAVIIGSFIISRYVDEDFVYYLTFEEKLKHLMMFGSKYVFWSIAPEIEFYFLFVGVWVIVAKRYILTNLPIWAFFGFILFVTQSLFPGVTVFHYLQIFLTGVGFAVLRRSVDLDAINKRTTTLVQVAGVLLIGMVVAGLIPSGITPDAYGWQKGRVYGSLPMALAFGAMVFAFSIETKFGVIVFGNLLMRRIGAYSFSIYLLHEPIADYVRDFLVSVGVASIWHIPLAFLVILLMAALSFHLFEMPMQSMVRAGVVKLTRKILSGETMLAMPQPAVVEAAPART